MAIIADIPKFKNISLSYSTIYQLIRQLKKTEQMSRIDIEVLLDRYLKGEASPAEIDLVETWLNEHGTPDS